MGSETATGTDTAPLSLSLVGSDGAPLSLPSGEPALLFLLATFDDASQLALTPLVELVRRRPKLRVIGIALQPDPGPLLQAYGEALAVNFPLTVEPDATLLSGTSALTDQVTVPMLVAVDGDGHVIRTFFGVPKVADLDALADLVADAR